LISIHSAEENDFIRNYVEEQPSSTIRVWIGLRRSIYSLNEWFVWVDKSLVDYVNWFSPEPDNKLGLKPYVVMWILNGEWTDWNEDKFAFVCGFNCKLSMKISK
jgi:hypothetical protein